jgi:hypothetical protein
MNPYERIIMTTIKNILLYIVDSASFGLPLMLFGMIYFLVF